MAEESSTHTAEGRAALPKPRFLLHVVSPAVEVPDRLSFPDTSKTLKVFELKNKIQEAVPSRPPPSRQRLIYRGKPLLQLEATLLDVIGQETIDSSESITLHLVLPPSQSHARPSMASLEPRPASTPPISPPSSRPMGLPDLPQINDRTSQVPLGAAAQFIPSMPPMFAQHGQPSIFVPLPQNSPAGQPPAISPMIAQMQAQHMAMMGQMAQHVQHHRQHFQTHFQNHIAQGQQARAAVGQHGIGAASPRPELNVLNQPVQRSSSAPGHPTQTRPESQLPPQQPQPQLQPGNIPGFAGFNIVVNGQPLGRAPTPFQGQAPVPSLVQMPRNTSPPFLQVRYRIQQLEDNLSAERPPSATDIAEAATMLEAAIRAVGPLHGGEWQMLSDRLRDASTRALTIETRQRHQTSASLNSQPFCFVLNSPSGPHSLLISSQGVFMDVNTTLQPHPAGSLPPGSAATFPRPASHTQSRLNPTQIPQPRLANQQQPPGQDHEPNQLADAALNIPPPPPGAVNATHPHASHDNPQPQGPGAAADLHPQQQQQQQQQPAPPGEQLAAMLLPLGGPLWLLIRLLGFIYVFTNGASWRRLILISLATIVVVLAQSGILQPLRNRVWEPIRRHVEGLIRLEPDGRRPLDAIAARQRDIRAAGAATGAEAGPGEGGSTVQRRRAVRASEATPQQMAERILREQQGDEPVWRRQLRRVERAAALFVASLVPDIGERYVAQRRRVEDERQSTQRRREQSLQEIEREVARLEQLPAEELRNDASTIRSNMFTWLVKIEEAFDENNAQSSSQSGSSSQATGERLEQLATSTFSANTRIHRLVKRLQEVHQRIKEGAGVEAVQPASATVN